MYDICKIFLFINSALLNWYKHILDFPALHFRKEFKFKYLHISHESKYCITGHFLDQKI